MPLEPTLADLITAAIDSRLLDVHTMLVAKVVLYDAAKQSATVVPVVNGAAPTPEGGTVSEPLPNIPNVPVRWERAGGYYDHKPLAAGDFGMLIFSESAFAHWRANGEISDPVDISRHAMSYPYFVPGAWPDTQPLPDAPSSGEAVSIVPADGHLRVSKAGSGSADFVALAAKVETELQKIATAFSSFVPGSGGASFAQPYTSPGAVAATSLKSD